MFLKDAWERAREQSLEYPDCSIHVSVTVGFVQPTQALDPWTGVGAYIKANGYTVSYWSDGATIATFVNGKVLP